MTFPKFPYLRSPKLLDAVRALPCQCCGCPPRSEASHSNQSQHGKGKAVKASDIYTAALCRVCHVEVDSGKNLSREQRTAMWTAAWIKTVNTLVQAGTWPQDIQIPDIRRFQ
jgi:hypothetical protein